MADQNLPMSNEIPTVVGHNAGQFFLAFKRWRVIYSAFCSKRKLVDNVYVRLAGSLIKRYCKYMMSDLIFVLSDQNGDLIRHMSFQENSIQYCANVSWQSLSSLDTRSSILSRIEYCEPSIEYRKSRFVYCESCIANRVLRIEHWALRIESP